MDPSRRQSLTKRHTSEDGGLSLAPILENLFLNPKSYNTLGCFI